jgi:hypothetical protein
MLGLLSFGRRERERERERERNLYFAEYVIE